MNDSIERESFASVERKTFVFIERESFAINVSGSIAKNAFAPIERVSFGFIERVIAGFFKTGFSFSDLLDNSLEKPLVFAVSGGVDSMTLLHACSLIAAKTAKKKRKPYRFEVLTIDHSLRPKSESARDAQAVADFCKTLPNTACTIITLGAGQAENTAKLRGRGIEEAARFLRYEAFEKFAAEKNAACVCTAHTQDDQAETVLFRFLQGSANIGAIKSVRGIFVRPMLEISREDIVRYAEANKIEYCVDKTNEENRYARNKIRNILIPHLNEHFFGWKKAVLSGNEKFEDTADFIGDSIGGAFSWTEKSENMLAMSAKEFYALHRVMRREALYRALELLKSSKRIPYYLISDAISERKANEKLHVNSSGIVIERKKKEILVYKQTLLKKPISNQNT
ncbi:MAG: hypothetical protein Ta2A_23810 [Treponemataceae bacterium]|nr:MAG: hypothetical protein Ta2A_23810 [Treponemataceae bacterium]